MTTIKRKDGFNGERALVLPKVIVERMEGDPLTSTLHITDIGYYPKAQHHFRERKEPINQYVFIYCTDGEGRYRIGEHEYAVSANQYFILPAGIPHAYASDNEHPWTIYWIHFKGNKADLIAAMLKSCVLESHPNISRTKNRLTIFEEMYSALHSCMTFENLCYANLCLPHFLATFLFNEPFIENSKAIEYNTKVDALIYFMNENITERLMLKDFASYIGLSASYLHRIFLKETGLSPMECFNRLKIIRACEYLINGTLKIIQISNLLGFTDPYYFSRIFTKIVGISPSVFRAQNDIGLIPGLIDKTPKQK